MSLRLILTRHAKSAWGDPSLDDHDRPLSRRGQAAATALGNWLAANGHAPDLVISSSARRTRETWELAAPALAEPPELQVTPELYLASPEIMLRVLRGVGRGPRKVMMLGHNPGCAYFAAGLLRDRPADAGFDRYPTGATTVVDFRLEDWADVAWDAGALVDFIVPRELV